MQTERGWKGGRGEYTPPPPLRRPPKQCAVVRAPAQCKGCYQLAAQRRARVEKKPSRAKTNPTFRQGPLVVGSFLLEFINSIDFDLHNLRKLLTIINICSDVLQLRSN